MTCKLRHKADGADPRDTMAGVWEAGASGLEDDVSCVQYELDQRRA